MALCPQCDHSVLVHTLLTDNLAGYSCGKCLGTLVSLVAYRVWRERAAREAIAPIAAATMRPPITTAVSSGWNQGIVVRMYAAAEQNSSSQMPIRVDMLAGGSRWYVRG